MCVCGNICFFSPKKTIQGHFRPLAVFAFANMIEKGDGWMERLKARCFLWTQILCVCVCVSVTKLVENSSHFPEAGRLFNWKLISRGKNPPPSHWKPPSLLSIPFSLSPWSDNEKRVRLRAGFQFPKGQFVSQNFSHHFPWSLFSILLM